MMNRLAALLLGLSLFGSSPACTVSATNLVFGLIDPLVATHSDSAADIDVSCPSTTSYTVQLGPGRGTYPDRRLVSGSDYLSYNLYSDASRTTVWGDGSGGSVSVNGSADATGTRHTVYGRVPHDPQAVPGSYSDTIVVTVVY